MSNKNKKPPEKKIITLADIFHDASRDVALFSAAKETGKINIEINMSEGNLTPEFFVDIRRKGRVM